MPKTRQLGHAVARTTARYSHHRPQADDAAKLARAFTTPTPEAIASTTVEEP